MGAVPKIVPISELRQDAASIMRDAEESGEPVFVTRRGRAKAVLMSAASYERMQRELDVATMLLEGEADIAEGATRDAKASLTRFRETVRRHNR